MQYTPFGKKSIAWDDVTRFYMSAGSSQRYDEGGLYGNVVGRNTHIRFWIGIADAEELKAEIARRAVNAIGGWQRQEGEMAVTLTSPLATETRPSAKQGQ